jgi:hypothetical protein
VNDYDKNRPSPEVQQRRTVAAHDLAAGGSVTEDHAVELANSLLEIARVAMPGTFFVTDSRCQLARAVIAQTKHRSPEAGR